MEVISLILSGLALLVSVVTLILFILREKRDKRQRESLLEYIDKGDDLSIGAAKKHTRESAKEQMDCFDQMFETFDERVMKAVAEKLSEFGNTFDAARSLFERRISDLEKGICPDYDAALAAKESVDRFSEGIMNILCYGNPTAPKEKKESTKEDKG